MLGPRIVGETIALQPQQVEDLDVLQLSFVQSPRRIVERGALLIALCG